MALERMTQAGLKAHLAPPKNFDPEVHEFPRVTLDRGQHWFRTECTEGHVHLISLPAKGPEDGVTVFECAPCGGQRYEVSLVDDDA